MGIGAHDPAPLHPADVAFYQDLPPLDARGMPVELAELHARYYRALLRIAHGNVTQVAHMARVERKTVMRSLTGTVDRRRLREKAAE